MEQKRKIGFLILLLWILTLITFVLALTFNPTASKWFSPAIDSLIMVILMFGSFVLLPISAFLIRNKLFKIVSLAPIVLFAVLLLTLKFIISVHKIIGPSMSPNLINGQYIITEKISYLLWKPIRGDIVVYKTGSSNRNTTNIARIIATPEDKIKIKNGKTYINDKLLVEPYTNDQTAGGSTFEESNEYKIDANQYVVMGDNRFHSADSRDFGPITIDNIKGKVFYSYWPKDKIGFVKNQAPVLTTNFINDNTEQESETTCITLGTKMIIGFGNKGQIGCDVYVNGKILESSYCESQQTHKRQLLRPDLYNRSNRYFATLTGLNFNEPVKVYVYSLDDKMVECLPDLNK